MRSGALLGLTAAVCLTEAIRPPAVPLLVHEPFVSVWSGADNLTDAFPSFWAGQTLGFLGMLRVDGAPFRWMGVDTFSAPAPIVPAAQQVSLTVGATQTKYTFIAGGVRLLAIFTTPAIGGALGGDTWDSWVHNPASYITLDVSSADGKAHAVQLYLEHTAELVVNNVSSPVVWSRDSPFRVPYATVLRMGSAAQPVLGASGDNMRISWGYQYLAIPSNAGGATDALTASTTMTWNVLSSLAFVANGSALPADDPAIARPCNDQWPVLAAAWDMGTLSAGGDGKSTYAIVAYDTEMALDYFGAQLAPAWMQGGARSMGTLLTDAVGLYDDRMAGADIFDGNENAAFTAAADGDARYAEIASLAYRQVVGSMVFATPPNAAPACVGGSGNVLTPYWAFMEEQSSDGDVSTVDVLYPASPFLLMYAPSALWAALVPIFDYANNCSGQAQWAYNLPWAPHDLGTWPLARRGPSQQEQMPLEESGNMVIMAAGVAAALGRVDFIQPYQWALLQAWADFCNASLPMPPSQLATDDFAGPAPNNTNLVIKGIVALGAFAQLLGARGGNSSAEAALYRGWAAGHVAFLRDHATDSSLPGLPRIRRQYQLADGSSWSLKYNALYEYVLDLGVLPRDLVQGELRYYLAQQAKPFGIPLDDRYGFALTEYMGAMLGMAGAEAATNATWMPALLGQIAAFVDTTQPRVPMTDWYNATTAVKVGFQSRATVGDLFALALLKRGIKPQ